MPTPLIGLPYIVQGQAQKEVTHNEALNLLDAVIQLSVKDRNLSAPPSSPAEGDRYIVAASPSGAWAGHAGDLTWYRDGGWRFLEIKTGWRVWSEAEQEFLLFDGAVWRSITSITELQNMSLLGINTTADAANRLSVASANVLLTHEGSDHRLKLNKQAPGNTASIVLQDSFSGRAEFGLTGDDDLHLKVSADGAVWNEAMVVDRSTGSLNLPAGRATLPATADPVAPAAGKLTAFVQDAGGGRLLLAQRAANGLPTPLQPFLGQRRVSHWMSVGGNQQITLNGAGATVAIGTATARVPASTRMFTSLRRIGYVSSAAAGSSCGVLSHNGLVFWRGNAAGLGGFHLIATFGVSDGATVADSRMFAGLYASTAAIGNVNPSTLLNCVGVGCDSGETSLHIMSNDNAGVATRVNLGASFPSQTLSTDWYELALYAPPNAGSIAWRLTRLNTGDVASGTLSSDLPLNTQFLAPQIWRNNGSTALPCGIDIGSIYVETDY